MSTISHLDGLPENCLLTASLFGGVSDLTPNQSNLDTDLQALIKDARSRHDMSWEDIASQVVKLAQRYPDIVDLQSLGGILGHAVEVKGDQPAEMSDYQVPPGEGISGAGAPRPESRDAAAITSTRQEWQQKCNRRANALRGRIRKNNIELSMGRPAKSYGGEAYNDTPSPYGQRLEQLMEIIHLQVQIYPKLAELHESATKSGLSEFLLKWAEKKWLPDLISSYREELKEQYNIVVNAIGSN